MERRCCSVRVESENSPRPESEGLKHCGFFLCPVRLLTYTRMSHTLLYHWGSSVNGPSFILCCEILVFLRPPQVETWFRTNSSSSKTRRDYLLLTGRLLTELPCFVSTFVSVAFMQIFKLVFVVVDSVFLFQFWKFRTPDPVTFCRVQSTREA